MRVVLIRHAIAEDRALFAEGGRSDALRPLSARGRKKMRRNGPGLLQVVPVIGAMATSGLVRAVQTTKILQEFYPDAKVTKLKALEPDAPLPEMLLWLRKQARHQVVALIGHDPHLIRLAGWLLTGQSEAFVVIKKGGLCVLDFYDKIDSGQAQLQCLIPPSILGGLVR